MPQLNIQLRRSTTPDGHPVTWVRLTGFIDASTVLSFENALELVHRDERGDVVLDFAEVQYTNSSGIGTILNYRNLLLQDGRELFLIAVNPQVRATFDLLGLSAVVPCLPDEETAQAYIASAPAGQRDPDAFVRRPPTAVAPEAPPREEPEVRPRDITACNVLMIAPEENRFTDVTRMRLLTPNGRFEIVTDCDEALRRFDEVDPDLIILEDPMRGSEDFLWAVKTEKGRSVVPVIKLYWRGTDINSRREFKIWEDDYLVEPFEVMELFALSEAELRRIPESRKVILHQTHLEFRTRPENLARANQLTARLIAKAGLDGESAAAMEAAVAEALENAARHGNAYDPEKYIELVFLLDREKLSITVTDQGQGFDYAPLVARAAEQASLPEERLKRSRGGLGGLGIALMMRCTDELEYLDPGNSVRLTKRL